MVSGFIRTELKIDNSIFSNLVNFFQTSRLQMFSHLPLTPQHMQVIYTITWNILTYAENAPRFDKRRHRNQSWKKVYKVKKCQNRKVYKNRKVYIQNWIIMLLWQTAAKITCVMMTWWKLSPSCWPDPVQKKHNQATDGSCHSST